MVTILIIITFCVFRRKCPVFPFCIFQCDFISSYSVKISSVPTSAPLKLSVEDVNESSLTIKWQTPETIGDSGLDGYTVEYCKDGSKSTDASEHSHVLCVYVQHVRL